MTQAPATLGGVRGSPRVRVSMKGTQQRGVKSSLFLLVYLKKGDKKYKKINI